MKVRKAVIAAAGLGTRMFPITKTIDKAMLPIGSRPAIDLIVAKCKAAGVEQIAMVLRSGSTQLQHYYTPDSNLESLLARHSWQSKGEVFAEIGCGLDFQFIYQCLEIDDYGTAVPLLLAADFIDGEPFYYISGDDICIPMPSTASGQPNKLDSSSESPETSRLVQSINCAFSASAPTLWPLRPRGMCQSPARNSSTD